MDWKRIVGHYKFYKSDKNSFVMVPKNGKPKGRLVFVSQLDGQVSAEKYNGKGWVPLPMKAAKALLMTIWPDWTPQVTPEYFLQNQKGRVVKTEFSYEKG